MSDDFPYSCWTRDCDYWNTSFAGCLGIEKDYTIISKEEYDHYCGFETAMTNQHEFPLTFCFAV